MSKWMCPNCGEEMPELYSLQHYLYCAISTPPQAQPYRGKTPDEARWKKGVEWFKKKMGRGLQ